MHAGIDFQSQRLGITDDGFLGHGSQSASNARTNQCGRAEDSSETASTCATGASRLSSSEINASP